ncbi:MAG: nitroreductase family protein [Gammaproteobacteria bacterium]|nr:nitroreductase family protein [Gammaproteobacteria bacterium]NNM10576.1 nitroreductase family protein [Pseudomonadales bacterium]RZV56765.1 MAG: nitroreductase [Pseudomonadales bacterium]
MPKPDFSVRRAAAGVDTQFVQRWSPRDYLPDAVDAQHLKAIFDAARWSPSCYNDQPWRFVTCTAQSHAKFLSCLVEANQAWAANAPVLGFAIARLHFSHNGKPNAHAVFDTGAAWMALNLQAHQFGYHAHGMAGVDFGAAEKLLEIDTQREKVVCAFTIGLVNPQGNEPITERNALESVWQQR